MFDRRGISAKARAFRKVRKVPSTVFISREFNSKDSKRKEEVLEVHKFMTDPAEVSISYGVTINMGNYESCRLDIGVKVPCYREQISDVYEKASSWVETRIEKEVASIRASVDKL